MQNIETREDKGGPLLYLIFPALLQANDSKKSPGACPGLFSFLTSILIANRELIGRKYLVYF
jgi:hypothetical protein